MTEPDCETPWRDDDDAVPISAIEHFSYCPRQCALVYVERTAGENAPLVRGRLAHSRVDSGFAEQRAGVRTLRAVPLWSLRLGLRGKADAVELRPSSPPFPIEYKVGRRRPPHADLQLCAQALCLEEMTGAEVPEGAIYSHAERRRYRVRFEAGLRSRTEEIVRLVREQFVTQSLPPAVDDARCPPCSVVHACLPRAAARPDRLAGLQSALFRPPGVPGDEDDDGA